MAYYVEATGWPPSEVRAASTRELELFLLYRAVKGVTEHGGKLFPNTGDALAGVES
jgi:hypothetical protein